MSLLGAITNFASGTYTVTREASPTFALGRQVAGAQSTFTIEASVQPYPERNRSGAGLVQPDSGQYGEELRVVYTSTQLKTQTPTTVPDRISIDGESWKVIRSEQWAAFGETHYRVTIAREALP